MAVVIQIAMDQAQENLWINLLPILHQVISIQDPKRFPRDSWWIPVGFGAVLSGFLGDS